MKKFFGEFKTFILRGNVLDMAVGIIIGGAFTAIVTSLTENFLQPLLNFVFGAADENWSIGGAVSAFLTAVVTFIITAFVLFCIIKAVNKLASLKNRGKTSEPDTKVCPYCLSDIPAGASRCPNCTSVLERKR